MNLFNQVRIARISTVPFFIVAQLKHQIATLTSAGASVTVVSSKGPELAVFEGMPGVRCATIDIRRSISLWRDLWALVELVRLFKSQRILIAHSTTPKAGLLTALAALIARVPIRLHTFTGQPWVNMSGLKRWIARSSDRLVCKLNTRCYADSLSQRRFLIDQQLIDDENLAVIGAGSLAGVDVRRFDPQRFTLNDRLMLRRSLAIPDDAFILLFVGRITVEKGIRELLKAFHQIKQIETNVHLLIVGSFDVDSGVAGDISRSEIEQLRDTHIVGYTDLPEKYMAIADLLCLPSYREGFGTVVIESAAMGVPTVGSDIYGLSDAVIRGETGLLVAPRNVEALSCAILELLKNDELRQKMSKASMQRARTSFDAEMVNALIVQEYARLLHAKGLLV
jgi:glycosyltransferase involved in cell wall biosynthesis